MDEHDDVGALFGDEALRLFVGVDFAPRLFQPGNGGTLAPAHLREAIREKAVGEDRYLGALFDKVDDGSFHSRRTRPGHGDREFVRSSEDVAQQFRRVAEDFEECGVRVSDQRGCHCLIHTWIDHARAGP